MPEFNLDFIMKSILVGFLVIPLFKTLSLHALQFVFIYRNKLPLSGVKWVWVIPIMIQTYLNFLFFRQNKSIACQLDNDKGGFKWNGIFNWQIWREKSELNNPKTQ